MKNGDHRFIIIYSLVSLRKIRMVYVLWMKRYGQYMLKIIYFATVLYR